MACFAYQQSPFYWKILQKYNLTVEDFGSNWNRVPLIQKRKMVESRESVLPYKEYGQLGGDKIHCEAGV